MWIKDKLKNLFKSKKVSELETLEIDYENMEKHEIVVYDENGEEIERCMEPLVVSHLTRIKHVFDDYITYSFNTHYTDGSIMFGMIPNPPFNIKIK